MNEAMGAVSTKRYETFNILSDSGRRLFIRARECPHMQDSLLFTAEDKAEALRIVDRMRQAVEAYEEEPQLAQNARPYRCMVCRHLKDLTMFWTHDNRVPFLVPGVDQHVPSICQACAKRIVRKFEEG